MDSLGIDVQSVALIGPDEDRRKAVAKALAGCKGGEVREFFAYPASLDDVPKLLEQYYDVIIIDLDSNPEYALELVECVCSLGVSTVMVYSEKTDSEMLVRCMRAGAREYLTLPFAEDTMGESLARASARRPAVRPAPTKKAGGRLLGFLGAKGGDGVTTLACNFAVALAQESSQSTILIDLDLPLGDAALNLGVTAEYSAINALQNASRLDSSFLSKLLVKHSSGVSVLAAPGKFPQFPATDEAIDRLIMVARQDFENVVIDMGSRLDLMGTCLFKESATIYLVIQAGIAGLRNSNRLISQYFATEVPRLEIVLNRFQSRSLGVAEDQITKALTRPAQWKIPNDYAAVRRMQHTAIPLALEDSAISRLIRQMARSACGMPATPEKGSGFSLKKISRSISAKISNPEESPSYMHSVILPEQDNAEVQPGAAAPEATVESGDAVDSADNGARDSQEQPRREPEEENGTEAVNAATGEQSTSPQSEPETRTYKGATYLRGADGQWHLQKSKAEEEAAETPVIAWSTPAQIVYGIPLGGAQLNAMASVPGRFVYTPAAGELLPAGEQTLSVVFAPEDTAGFTDAQATVQLTVAKATPVLAWPAPAPISCTSPLGAAQLNATASIAGEFTYRPAAGEVLAAGKHTLKAIFTPKDKENYNAAEVAVQITASRIVPVILWPTPAPIAYGTALSSTQLNAATPVPGRFTYKPSAGEVLHAGVQTLSVSFVPANEANYAAAQAVVALTVTQATPIVTWPALAAITEGIALSASELNATALVPGSFVYEPAAGEILSAGTHTLTVTFTPADVADYTVVQTTTSLTVAKKPVEAAEPVWPVTPAAPILEEAPVRTASVSAEVPIQRAEAAPVEDASIKFEAEETVAAATGKPKKLSAKAAQKAAKELAKALKAQSKARTKAPAEVEEEYQDTLETEEAQPVESQVRALVRAMAPRSPIDVGSGAGSGLDLMGSAVFEDGTTIYLVMQPGSAGLSSANRMVSQFFSAGGPKPDFVINRYEPRAAAVPEGESSTALTRPATVPFSRMVGQMAQPAAEQAPAPEKKGFSLKGFSKSIWAKFSTPEKPTGLGLADDSAGGAAAASSAQQERAVVWPINSTQGSPPYGATRTPVQPAAPVNTRPEPETRIYKGATYARGADGQWHLKAAEPKETQRPAAASAWAMPAPVESREEFRPTQFKPQTPAPIATRKAAGKKKPVSKKAAAKKNAAKAPAKGQAKVAQKKPALKAAGKQPAKTAQKPAAKVTGKAPVKGSQQPLVKAATKPLMKATGTQPAKAAAKPTAKSAAKLPSKVGQKVQAKAKSHKAVPARAKPATAAKTKTVEMDKSVQPFLPELQLPVAEPIVVQPVAEAVASQTTPEATN
ncbi:MAG: hypothetical protein ABR907_02430 [Terracidiphilus sp.]